MSLLNIIAIIISIIWFILFVTKKYEKAQIWVFMLSHYVFYINIYILKNWDNLFTPIVIVNFANIISPDFRKRGFGFKYNTLR